MSRLLVVVITSWFMSSLAFAEPATTPQSSNDAMDEVRQSFTLGGKPIPPGIFRDLGDGDIADSTSILVTVDLKAAVGSNRYYEDIGQSGKWVVQKKADKDVANGWEASAYNFIGSTTNNLLVVISSHNGGGSGTFYTLHLLDLAPGKALDSEGQVYERLNLTTVQDIPLGDRWQGTVTISGNFIDVLTTKDGPADTSDKTTVGRIEARRP
jgi:hypothetical protein